MGNKTGKLLHFVVGVGTGGTISKLENTQRKPNIKLWGIDTYGSVFKKYQETDFDEKRCHILI
jgi:cystathionine beta-synthase